MSKRKVQIPGPVWNTSREPVPPFPGRPRVQWPVTGKGSVVGGGVIGKEAPNFPPDPVFENLNIVQVGDTPLTVFSTCLLIDGVDLSDLSDNYAYWDAGGLTLAQINVLRWSWEFSQVGGNGAYVFLSTSLGAILDISANPYTWFVFQGNQQFRVQIRTPLGSTFVDNFFPFQFQLNRRYYFEHYRSVQSGSWDYYTSIYDDPGYTTLLSTKSRSGLASNVYANYRYLYAFNQRGTSGFVTGKTCDWVLPFTPV